MISITDLRQHILAAADELDLPLTIRQVNQLSNRATLRATLIPDPQQPVPALTGPKLDVLFGLAAGEEAEETGRRICRSIDTVKSHRRALYSLLGAKNGAHAVAIASTLGLLGPGPCDVTVSGGCGADAR